MAIKSHGGLASFKLNHGGLYNPPEATGGKNPIGSVSFVRAVSDEKDPAAAFHGSRRVLERILQTLLISRRQNSNQYCKNGNDDYKLYQSKTFVFILIYMHFCYLVRTFCLSFLL